jgi:asparagine synthase (glutamine-hydrolysing)
MVSSQPVDRRRFARTLDLLAHRGPDGEGVWERGAPEGPFVALGHRRLAIIDLSNAAAQPMASDDGSLQITYNGEIYNYVELMAELEAKGHRFRSRSDTEVILRAYEEWGTRCLERLNGMFAFAIWNERERELFAARDRFGEKPFHYAWDPGLGLFAFSSEIKALPALADVDLSLDDRALYRFAAFQELAGATRTLYRGVMRLPHAHWARVRAGAGGALELAVQRYWDIDLERRDAVGLGDAAERLRELFAESVRLRLRSDVPVGTSLSGGLDSSAVVCQVHALGAAGGQKAFSARMEDPALDEGRYIGAVLDKTGIEGHEVWPTADELESHFPRVCYHLEEPFLQPSQFAQHLVMRLARDNGVTVLLDGQGADELLAGYTPYFLTRYAEMAEARQFVGLLREWRGFRSRHPGPFPLTVRSLAVRAAPGLYRLARPNGDGGAAPAARWGQMAAWWDADWLRRFADEPAPEPPSTRRSALTRRLYSDTMGGELQELLRYGDRNSMAWSREVRQPFLDHRIAEFLFALPADFKLRDGETKVVFRRAVADLIPADVLRRQDKLGYQAPLPVWLAGPLRSWARDRLAQAAEDLGGRLVRDAVARFDRLGSTIREDEARPIFSLLTLAESRRQLLAVARPSSPALC